MRNDLPDDLVEQIASGECHEVDSVGTDFINARRQAYEILGLWNMQMTPVLVALITKIQQQQKAIKMFEYNQRWRKRRP